MPDKPKTPMIMKGMESYRSPVTGELIAGRKARAKDLAQHGCIDARDNYSRERGEKIREREHEKSFKEHVDGLARHINRS